MLSKLKAKLILAKIIVWMIALFFILPPALSAICVSGQMKFSETLSADIIFPVVPDSNTAAKKCCPNKSDPNTSKWSQHCDYLESVQFSKILKTSVFNTKLFASKIIFSRTLNLITKFRSLHSSSSPPLLFSYNSPLFEQKTALLI